MAAELYYDFWISARQYDVGPSSGTPSQYQAHNATKIKDYFTAQGWTLRAIAAMLGNMQYESCLDPACVYPKSSFPNAGASITDLDNNYAINITRSAYGLVQWYGTTTTAPAGNQLVSYAMRHGYQWYDGNIQLARLQWEWSNEQKWHPKTLNGVRWTFSSFASNTTETPEALAKIFMQCYEDTYLVVEKRQANAKYWFDYFGGGGDTPTPPTPDPGPEPEPDPPIPDTDWISGVSFAFLALEYKDQYLPYDLYDCVGFVNMVWHDIPAGSTMAPLPNGTNSLWRSTRTINTTSPDGETPCPLLWWKGTIAQCVAKYHEIPAGALLFHQISEEGPPAIPSQYAGDGIGNFVHVGIYCGNSRVMQSGGRDSASVPGGGVHLSAYDPDAWTHVAFICWVSSWSPPVPWMDTKTWLWFQFNKHRKGRILK